MAETIDIDLFEPVDICLVLTFLYNCSWSKSRDSTKKGGKVRMKNKMVETPVIQWEIMPDWASLELSPSVEWCGCGFGPSPVRLG